jgi:cell wall-associated NlpC family hydrolase
VTDGRKRTSRVLATLCTIALGGGVLIAGPTFADQDVESVQTRVDALYHQAEVASERYNDARLEMKRARTRLGALESDLHRQQSRVDDVRKQVAAAVVTQYQGQALSSTTQVLLSDDPDSFLSQLSTISEYNDQQSQIMADFAVQAKQLELREAAAEREVRRIAETKKRLGVEKAEIDDKAARAKRLLGTLKAEEAAKARAAARASRSADRAAASAASAAAPAAPTAPAAPAATAPASSSAPASGRAAAAVAYALAQVGDAYVFGAAGPSAFDCSGLTMMAWQQAGVSLPHSSSAQMGSGTPVSQSELQPGDLVFYYSPVSHVGMYIGGGRIVNALNPGAGVAISDVNSMPYSGAVRPG